MCVFVCFSQLPESITYLLIRLIALCPLLDYALEYTTTFNNFTIHATCYCLNLQKNKRAKKS